MIPLRLTVVDNLGLAGTDTAQVTVTNQPPIVSPIAVVKNERKHLELGAAFADPGRLDTHTATINWGDGTQTRATVAERNGVGLAGGSHSYKSKGNYTVRVTVSDDDGGSSQRSLVVTLRQ